MATQRPKKQRTSQTRAEQPVVHPGIREAMEVHEGAKPYVAWLGTAYVAMMSLAVVDTQPKPDPRILLHSGNAVE